MKTIIKSIVLLSLTLFITCSSNDDKTIFIAPDNDNLEYMGRIGETDSTTEIYWSGSSVKIEFTGTAVSAVLQDENGNNYFNIILDNDHISLLRPDTLKKLYALASGLPHGKHSVQIFKRTEWIKGKTSFYGFKLNVAAKIIKILPKEKMIEFYGNSITAGYAVEDYSGKDNPDSIYTNNYNSYAAMTARYFNAAYSCIARSGIGITISWFPQIMKEMYYRFNPSDSKSFWEFKKTVPQIVVINLFQNDSWLVERPEFEQFKNRFGTKKPNKEYILKAYGDFVKSIRGKYPKAKIICMLGNMDITRPSSIWPDYVEEAVKSLHDKNIFTLFAPYKNSPGHPRVEEQKMIANTLITFISSKNLWK